MIEKIHKHEFETVPIGVDFHRDGDRIRKPLPYSKNYLRACKKCCYAEMIEGSQVNEMKKVRVV